MEVVKVEAAVEIEELRTVEEVAAAEETTALEDEPLDEVLLVVELLRARILLAAASAATMTMACVLPVGRSGWIEASTTNRLSVP